MTMSPRFGHVEQRVFQHGNRLDFPTRACARESTLSIDSRRRHWAALGDRIPLHERR